jgi:peptidoglycan/xylan/chitin deacetylase (PgdA/CDA1 family)
VLWLQVAFRYVAPLTALCFLSAGGVLLAWFALVPPPGEPAPVADISHLEILRAEAAPDLSDVHLHSPPDPPIAEDVEETMAGVLAAAPEADHLGAAIRPRQAVEMPIIMYHHVGHLPAGADAIRRDLTVSPDAFEKQLQYFKENGIESVTLDALTDHLAGKSTLPPRAVALTFDDGYDDNFEFAFPLLEKYGMVGTFFVTVEFVEKPGYVRWHQLKEMVAGGMSIGAHGIDHADLAAVRPDRLRRQLLEPKQILEEGLGINVTTLAYPAGRFNRSVIQATQEAGYAAAVTVNHGTRHAATSPFELRRVRARGSDGIEQLVARMTPPSWRYINRQQVSSGP